MKWVIIKGVRYPSSVISAFAAYNMDNPFVKIRIIRVDKCDRCSGCAFENYIYDCVKSGCLGCEREDGESVRYTIVNT